MIWADLATVSQTISVGDSLETNPKDALKGTIIYNVRGLNVYIYRSLTRVTNKLHSVVDHLDKFYRAIP